MNERAREDQAVTVRVAFGLFESYFDRSTHIYFLHLVFGIFHLHNSDPQPRIQFVRSFIRKKCVPDSMEHVPSLYEPFSCKLPLKCDFQNWMFA